MATVIIYTSSKEHGFPINVNQYISELTVGTEVNKGFSDCRITIENASLAGIPVKNLTGASHVLVYEGGHVIWSGRVSAVNISGVSVSLDCKGWYDLLNDFHYDDGSELLYAMNSNTANPSTEFKLTDTVDHVAVAVTNTLYAAPLAMFALKLRRVDAPKGNIIPFVSTSAPAFDNSNLIYYTSIPVDSIGTAGTIAESVFFNMRAISDTFQIADGATFYVGVKVDSEYTTEYAVSGATKYVSFGYYFDAGNGNVRVFSSGAWATYADYVSPYFLYAGGKWDYNPGSYQKDIITDILEEYNVVFGSAVDLKYVPASFDSVDRQVPYFRVPLETKGYDAILKILASGDSSLRPLYMYVYSLGSTPSFSKNIMYIEPFNLTNKRPKAFVRIVGEDSEYSTSYDDLYTSVRVIFSDNDGILDQTDAASVGIAGVPNRQIKPKFDGIFDSEADILRDLYVSYAKQPYSNRNLTVAKHQVYTIGESSYYPLYKIRAGDVIAINDASRRFLRDEFGSYWTKYFVRSTTYDAVNQTLTIDLSRKSDKDFLIDILGNNQ